MSASKIGRYEITRELGRGGMATVYLARDPSFNRQVAVKVLPSQFTHDPQFRVRFEREAQVIARLEHPYIVPVYDFGQQGDQPFLVMRYLPGGTLENRIAEKPMPLAQVVPIIQRIAAALDAAHKRGVIHRDLKPGNIIFDADGSAYLSDFGIAKLAQESSALTGTGMMVGTPEYMSPEQAMGVKGLDHRSDLYTLGVIIYEMLTGQHPYEAETPVGLMLKHVTEPVPLLDALRFGLPGGCSAVLARAMAKKPGDRFASAGALVEALSTLGLGRPAASPRPAEGTRPQPAPAQSRKPEPAPARRPPVPAPVPQPAGRHAHHGLHEIACSNCGGAGLTLQPDGQVVCRFCGTANTLDGMLCPECEHLNPADAEHCENCSSALVRYCPTCQVKNWSGLEHCAACGSPLDALAYLSERWQLGTPAYQAQQRDSVKAIKAAEEEAAQRRMAQMMEAEQQRQKGIREATARRAARERQIMTYLAVGVILLGVLVVGGLLAAYLAR